MGPLKVVVMLLLTSCVDQSGLLGQIKESTLKDVAPWTREVVPVHLESQFLLDTSHTNLVHPSVHALKFKHLDGIFEVRKNLVD